MCAVDLDIVRQAAQRLDPPPRVVDTNPQNLYDVIADVARLGAELGPGAEAAGAEAAAALRRRVDTALAAAKRLAAARSEEGAAPPRVVFIEWVSPLFPGGHWTPQMIEMAGGCCPINPPTRWGLGGGGPWPTGGLKGMGEVGDPLSAHPSDHVLAHGPGPDSQHGPHSPRACAVR